MNLQRFDKRNFTPFELNSKGLSPDPDFNIYHNAKVLEETNREMDMREQVLDAKLSKAIGEASDMVASYAKYRLAGSGQKSIENYLGRAIMKELYQKRLKTEHALDGIIGVN